MNRNYQKELEQKLQILEQTGQVPKLMLHSCCAPCSSYVLEYLSSYFAITVFYYNPNIYPDEEYWKRVKEQKALMIQLTAAHPISFLEGAFEKKRFYEMAKGFEQVPEGGERCFGCYELRLRKTAEKAAESGFDYFTTTLSISPLKNAGRLNEIGERLGRELGVPYLNSDFKKKNGYKRSIELSREYGLYRQDYCGCIFSKQERQRADSQLALFDKVHPTGYPVIHALRADSQLALFDKVCYTEIQNGRNEVFNMAQLWGGRFTKETDQLVYNFNASISFDRKFYRQDIEGSKAHVKMLAKQGILTEEEKSQILDGLEGILKDVEDGTLEITEEYEDIHSFVEANLIDRIGEAGKKLHTGRSRNDQVALDMKLYTRDEILNLDALLKELLSTLLNIMEEHTDTFMPGFTHLQKAQPITLAHHLGAYFEMFKRDRQRLSDIYKRMNLCPLGSGALAGTTYPLDRGYTASLLSFDGPTLNSMDSVADRDYLIELLSAMSTIMMHLSRFSEEIIIWNSNEYQFVELDDAYSTGSSIMPQKKNPDIAELVRGKTGRVYGALLSLLTTMKGIPLAYNKDMQEDKELTFDAIDTVKGCVALFTGMAGTMKFNKKIMESSARNGFTNATDAADYLVNHGVPFRDAHGIVGRLVLYCLERNIALEDMSLEEYKSISPVFEEDIYGAISLKTCVEKRTTLGAPGQEAMNQVIAIEKEYLAL